MHRQKGNEWNWTMREVIHKPQRNKKCLFCRPFFHIITFYGIFLLYEQPFNPNLPYFSFLALWLEYLLLLVILVPNMDGIVVKFKKNAICLTFISNLYFERQFLFTFCCCIIFCISVRRKLNDWNVLLQYFLYSNL